MPFTSKKLQRQEYEANLIVLSIDHCGLKSSLALLLKYCMTSLWSLKGFVAGYMCLP